MKEEIDDFIPKIAYLSFPDWRLQSDFLDNSEITYVIEGKASLIIDGEPHDLESGDLLCLTEGSTRKAATWSQNPMRCFSVSFNSLSPFYKAKPPSFPTINHIGLRKELIDLFWELTVSWQTQQGGYIMKTRSLLMLILHRLSEILIWNIDSKTGDYRISKATNIIMQDYPDKLTVKDLARQVHLNEGYFGRLFKRTMGMSVNEYIQQVRVRNAENMLQSGNYKVYEVAGYCGFANPAHLYKSFRDVRGLSPSKYIPKSGELDVIEGL